MIATILLLALTVTLFGAIFAFVTSFPSPPPQSNNQFQASLFYPTNGSVKYVAGVRIVHLAGPATPGNALIYLKSANQPSLSIFQSPYMVSTELGASTWNLGQTLTITFPTTTLPLSGQNLTVYIVSQSTLLFSVILPGTSFSAPPTVVSTYIVPAAPIVGQGFTVYASLSGAYNPHSVFVSLAAVPGAPSAPEVMTQNAQGMWIYPLSSGATKNGTYYGFVNATSSTGSGQTAVGTVIITVTTAGTVNGPLSVGVVLVPAPPNTATAESVQAVVTYTGAALSSPAAVTVTFSATSSPSGYTFSGTGATGITISGPSGPASVTVASQTSWTIPNPTSLTLYTYSVTATATVAGVGSNTGTTSFTPAAITVSPTSGLMGSTATVRGAGFVASTNVNLTLGHITFGPSGTTNSTCTFSGTTITVTSSGTFVCQFVVPNGAPSGASNLVAADSNTGQNDTVTFTVTAWSIFAAPSAGGLMNSTVTIRGAGFVAATVVTLSFNGHSVVLGASCSYGTPTSGGTTITAGANGSFVACTFPVPTSASPVSNTVTATDSAGQTATTTFTVTAWTLTVSPSWVSIKSSSTTVTVTGAGFAAGSKVSIVYNGSLLTSGTLSFACTTGTLTGATITPSSGSLVCTLVLTRDPPGIYSFTATDYPSGQVATASVGRS